ncbi:MAG: hypothetical protein QNK40_02260, partial [Desulfobacterales bacterium]|nr:hypothetical protein [Desulfobacterales bacterium]MDX2446028.1 hypothetical protein [Desulfobacterales bacterium]
MAKRMNFSATLFLFTIMTCLLVIQTPVKAGKTKLNYANFPPAPTFPCLQMERWKTKEPALQSSNERI